MIEVDRLSKSYGSFQAVKDVSFVVERGEVMGFLGPNGAGKSTTLRIIAGFLGASSGDVRIQGHSIAREPLVAKQLIGYMPEASPLYPEMRVGEYLSYRAELKRVPRAARKASVDRAMTDAGLGEMERVLIGQLSKGYRQRVGLADALVASPPLLVLDEPTAGLDPNQIREVRGLIRRLREKHTILVSTHILSEVEAMCSRGVVIARGEVMAQGTIEQLRAIRRPGAVRVRVRGEAQVARRAVAELDGVASVDLESDASDRTPLLQVKLSDPKEAESTIERIAATLVEAKLGVLEIVPSSSLEQVFAELTQTSPEGQAPKKSAPSKKKRGAS